MKAKQLKVSNNHSLFPFLFPPDKTENKNNGGMSIGERNHDSTDLYFHDLKSLLLEYVGLATSSLSESDANRLEKILELVQGDEDLSRLVEKIDELINERIDLLEEDSLCDYFEDEIAKVKEFINTDLEQNSHLKKCIRKILTWANQGQSKVICVTNIELLRRIDKSLNGYNSFHADMLIPDCLFAAGFMAAKAKFGKQKMGENTRRFNSIDLLSSLFDQVCLSQTTSVFFVNFKHKTVQQVIEKYPRLQIKGVQSFHSASQNNSKNKLIESINDSGAGLVFFALQYSMLAQFSIWVNENKHKLKAVIVGIPWGTVEGISQDNKLIKAMKTISRKYFLESIVCSFLNPKESYRHKVECFFAVLDLWKHYR